MFSIISLIVASLLLFTGKKGIDKTNYRISQTYEFTGMIHECITAASVNATIPPLFLDSLDQLSKETKDLRTYLTDLHMAVNEKHPGPEILTILYSMLREEKALLADRKAANELANRRTTYLLIAGRIAAFLFVVIILLFLNQDITRHKVTQQKLRLAMEDAQQAKQMQERFRRRISG